MIPAILSSQIQDAVRDYLRTTFPITTPLFDKALERLISDPGCFIKGPYLSLGMPFRKGESSGEFFPEVPLGFVPHLHQLQAFRRLSGEDPGSAIVATGTGSGKTECFLLPILDHCRRNAGVPGIKAIIIYPMNALATDQAGRIASMINSNPSLNGRVTAGLYIGQEAETVSPVMTADSIINDRDKLRLSPPDILLTNYKMLDYMLIRPSDQPMWAQNRPETLRYLVVDELHTFDGAQGTDLACLLRRLKARLGTPDNHLRCVGTSASLGGEGSAQALVSYAERVFGERFGEGSVITESRVTAAEFLSGTEAAEFGIPEADTADLLPGPAMDMEAYQKSQARIWLGMLSFDGDWQVDLGRRIRAHALFRDLLEAVDDDVLALEDVIDSLVKVNSDFAGAPPGKREALLSSMLALLSCARSKTGGSSSPLVHVRMQLWMRELRRLVGSVGKEPILRFADDLKDDQLRLHLPMIHCRECGATGWGGVVRKLDRRVRSDLRGFYNEFFKYGKDSAFLFPEERDARELEIPGISARLCTSCLYLNRPEERACTSCGCRELVDVFQPDNSKSIKEAAGVSHDCPYCNAHDSLTIMGAQAATLTSVAISQLMSSPFNNDRKLLAFSDSVQDAAHRAGFFQARTWRFNLRIAIQQVLTGSEECYSLDRLPGAFIERWSAILDPLEYISTFIAPNMLWLREYQRMIETGELPPDSGLRKLVDARLDWEVRGEYCFSARIGRTLERSGLSIAHLKAELYEKCADLLLEPLRNRVGSLRELDREKLLVFLVGLVTHLKNRGAVLHPILDSYISDDGNTYHITQDRILWMPRFGPGTRAPLFPVDRTRKGHFERIIGNPGSAKSWYQTWSEKCFSDLSVLVSGDADRIWQIVLEALCEAGLLEARATSSGTAWGLHPQALLISRDVELLRCGSCGYIASSERTESVHWSGAPCPRGHCRGTLVPFHPESDYYSRFYSTSQVQRLYTREHTGLLGREERERLEREFRSPLPGMPRKPWYPNLLSSTPTLEMGIDIGDLSSLILCSVPPSRSNYLQRTGRAGRRDGNAMSLTVATGKPHDLYFFSEPLEMLSGAIETPDVFLGASAVLERQLAAYCFDRWVGTGLDAGAVPPKLGQVLGNMETENMTRFPWNFMKHIRANQAGLLEGFSGLFREELSAEGLGHLEAFLTGEGDSEGSLEWRILNGLLECRKERNAFAATARTLNDRIRSKRDEQARSQHWQDELDDLQKEKKAYQNLILALNSKATFNFLTDEGLLPNYAFPEAGVLLRSIIFRQSGTAVDEKGKWETLTFEYERAASSAIRELVPSSTFYAGGRRVVIDQVDMRLSDIEIWRFCDSCSHMELENPKTSASACPHCGSPLWKDAGQKRQMLRLKQVYASTPDRSSLITDDRDERTPVFYNRQMLVDFDERDVSGAWKLDAEDVPFGFEFLRKATFRDINFGEQSPFGEQVSIAGQELPRTGFKLCRHCGKVQDGDGKVKHTLTCSARRKDDPSTFLTTLYLYREFSSEAVRFLLPVSSMAASEKLLHSFVAALQLGLRLRFGGAVDHLQVTTSDEPVKDSVFRKKYLVLYDTVPGGTGYLKQLMRSPSELLRVLHLAMERMKSCICTRDPEKDGCYSCLFAYRQSYDMQSTSRDEAILFIARVLTGEGELKPVRTLGEISISSLLESELEELFIEELGKVKFGEGFFQIQKCVVGGTPGYSLKAGKTRWLIQPQVNLGESAGVSVPCRADFVFRPAGDMPGVKPIVVFTDGFRYHQDRLAQDMAQRTAISRSGAFNVWSITWNDIAGGSDAWFTDLLHRESSEKAEMLRKLLEGYGIRELDSHRKEDSFKWLLQYLAEPEPETWSRYAFTHAVIRMDGSISADPVRKHRWFEVVRESAGELASEMLESMDEPAQYGRVSEGPVTLFLKADETSLRSSSVDELKAILHLDDRIRDNRFREHWNGFLRLHNLLQFLPGCIAITPRSGGEHASVDVSRGRMAVIREAPGSTEWNELLSLVDLEVHPLLTRVRGAGLPLPQAGWELPGEDGSVFGQAELAWETASVAVLCGRHTSDRTRFEGAGWMVFTPEQEKEKPVVFMSALRERLEGGGRR